jgi:hypothetical protein
VCPKPAFTEDGPEEVSQAEPISVRVVFTKQIMGKPERVFDGVTAWGKWKDYIELHIHAKQTVTLNKDIVAYIEEVSDGSC